MRYRRLTYRYSMVVHAPRSWAYARAWQAERARLLPQSDWRPDADSYETLGTLEMTVDLAGVDEQDFEVLLYEDVLVVEGRRELGACPREATYHAAEIRQGPFRLELPLPAPVDPERVEATYDRGLLRITLHKRAGS
jgi:HSP20 family molecular chaperone IbpA